MTDAMTDVELARFRIADRTSVIVEVDERRRGATRVGAGDRLREAREYFDANLDQIREAAQATLGVLRKAGDPDEVKLSFAIKLTTEMGAVIARSAMEGNIGVELTWKRQDRVESKPDD